MKVVVVGAGPAGSSTAETILRLQPKHEVTIVEQKSSLAENPRCAGGVNAVRFDELGIQVPETVFASKISRFRLYSPNNDYWEIESKPLGLKHMGYVFHRGLLDKYLCERAQKLGAQLILNMKAKSVDEKSNILITDTGTVPFDVLVQARGPVIQTDKKTEYHIAIQGIVSYNHPQDLIGMYFGRELAPGGYGWVFPNGGDKVKVGVGIDSSLKASPVPYLKQLESKLGITGCDAVYSKYVPTGKPPKSGVQYGPCGTHILSVGDSLPACDPMHGGGIINAILTGQAAGRAIAGELPHMYDKFWRSELYKENMRRYRLKKILFGFRDQELNTMVSALKDFQPESASIGHELRRAISYLAKKAPSLMGRKLISALL